MEEASDVAFTTRAGKAVAFKKREEAGRSNSRGERSGSSARRHSAERGSSAAKPKPRPRAKKSAIREKPPEPLGIELPERPPPLERQPSTFPVMSSDDFGSLFSEYISSRKSQGRDSRLAMYRSWLAT